jgi:hypothetical protein
MSRLSPRNVERQKAKIGSAKKDHRGSAMVASTALDNNQKYNQIHDEINYWTETTPSKA